MAAATMGRTVVSRWRAAALSPSPGRCCVGRDMTLGSGNAFRPPPDPPWSPLTPPTVTPARAERPCSKFSGMNLLVSAEVMGAHMGSELVWRTF